MSKNTISLLVTVLFLVSIFIVSWLWRRSVSKDIERNGKYAIGVITKKIGSLKNGNKWRYQFSYQNKVYESYRSTHIGWEVHVGDRFLVKFSSKNPTHSKIFYEYLFKSHKTSQINYSGDTIPYSILIYRKKGDRFW